MSKDKDKNLYAAGLHSDYLAFAEIATNEQLGEFIRAQMCRYKGLPEPEGMSDMAKALLKAHDEQTERMLAAKIKAREDGLRGGNPALTKGKPRDITVITNPLGGVIPPLTEGKEVDIPITVTNTVTITESESITEGRDKKQRKRVSKSASTPSDKTPYGEFGNVLLTDEERDKLSERIGEPFATNWIEKLSMYLAQTGKKYSSHYATILKWHRDQEEKIGRSQPGQVIDINPDGSFRTAEQHTPARQRRTGTDGYLEAYEYFKAQEEEGIADDFTRSFEDFGIPKKRVP